MADGQVVFEITGDDKGINTTIKNVTANIQKESKKWDAAADDAAGEATGSWVAAAAKIAGALSAAGVVSILSKWGKAAIESASNLEEVQNVVDVTFGEGSGKIEKWAKAASKSFGLTETQAKRYTSTLGAMMKSQGIADDEIVQMSTDLAGLSADMASFYNLDFDEAFQKIRSGISGETEPLKQLGINMSQANLEAFALEKGITKAFSAMSQGEQTALRYQYIMQATADAQGDFSRTADGFANASRRVEAAMETIKTVGGGLLMEVVAPLTEGLASFLEQITSSDTTVLDDIAAIDTKTGEKVSKIHQTADDARLLTEELGKLEEKTELTTDEQALWLETCKRLVQTIPGLSAIINTETGEVEGGTQAVKDYVKAWEEGQTKLAMLGAIQQKESAISERFADLPGLQLDMAVAQRRVRQQKALMDAMRPGRAAGYSLIPEGMKGLTDEEKAWNEAVKTLNKLIKEENAATDAYTKQADALKEAQAALDEYKKIVEEMPGDVEAVTEAADKATAAQEKAIKASKEAVKQALTELSDYVKGVRDSTQQAVDSVVKGFANLERPTTDLLRKRNELSKQQQQYKSDSQEYIKLQKQIDELNKSINQYTPGGMKEGLQSQLAFMNEYLANLEKAQRMGLSNQLLASLSDGSVESAEYLAQLVANPEQASEVDSLYQQVQDKKDELTDALTEQKLTVDDTYQAMVDKANEAISGLDQQTQAQTALAATVQGIADGISSKTEVVQNAVDGIIAQLNRLTSFSFGGTSFTFTSPVKTMTDMISSSLNGSHATGLDYVPFDGYLASLHEGESILTAEENRVWQRFKNGSQPQTMDYDALGATMRDNVKPGGNVYLDGRAVGRVISDQQGADYRALKRSGWQS